MSRGSNAALDGEVAGSLGGVGREAPFLPQRQGGGHQAGVREPRRSAKPLLRRAVAPRGTVFLV